MRKRSANVYEQCTNCGCFSYLKWKTKTRVIHWCPKCGTVHWQWWYKSELDSYRPDDIQSGKR